MKKRLLVIGVIVFMTMAGLSYAVTSGDSWIFEKTVQVKSYLTAKYIRLYGAATSYYFTFTGTPTANRTITWQDAAGVPMLRTGGLGITIKEASFNVTDAMTGPGMRISYQGSADASMNMATTSFTPVDASTNGTFVTVINVAMDVSPAKALDASAPAGYVFYGYENGSHAGGIVHIAATSVEAGAMPTATMVFCRKNKICITPGSNTTITGR